MKTIDIDKYAHARQPEVSQIFCFLGSSIPFDRTSFLFLES